MTVKKAISGIDVMIRHKQKIRTGLLDPKMMWNEGESTAKRCVESIVTLIQQDVSVLYAIKKQLLPEQKRTKIICRHPKKDHDVMVDGQKYCMNCNANL